MDAAPTPGVNIAAVNLETALHFAAYGLPVFPCKPDKSPYTANGFKDAATDELSIQRWWRQFPDALPGIDCAAARLVVIDCDVEENVNGVTAFKVVAKEDGINLWASPCVSTQNGGAHCYFKAEPDFVLSNRTGSLPDGIHVRSNGYVIAPGAVLANGRGYVADSRSPDLAEAYVNGTLPTLPRTLRARLAVGKPVKPRQVAPQAAPGPNAVPPPASSATARGTAYARATLDGKARDLAALEKGGRNRALNDHAYVMGRMAAAGWIDRTTVETALMAAAATNGMAADDGLGSAAATFASGWNGGMQAGPHDPLADGDVPILPNVAALMAQLQAGQPVAPMGISRLGAIILPSQTHLGTVTNGSGQGAQGISYTPARNSPGVALGSVLGAVPAAGDDHSGGEGVAAVAASKAVLLPIVPHLWTSADFVLTSHQQYVIKGLIAPGNVGVLLGHPGAGKSTLAPYLAYAVARGFPFCGMRTRKGRTLYLAAEDAPGVKKRLYALGLRHGHTADCAMMECGNLRDPAANAIFAAAVLAFNPTLIVLDTLAAAFAGMDENSSADMGAVVAWLRGVAAIGIAVLVVHHPAKQADGGSATARGHGSLNGTLDMSLILTPDDVTDADALVRGRLAKNRNGSTARTLAFRKEVIVLGQDAEGDNITTTLPIEEDADADKPALTMTKHQEKALMLLRQRTSQSQSGKVTEWDWRNFCEDQKLSTSDNPKTRKEAFNNAYAKLLETSKVAVGEGMVWPLTGGR